MKLILFDKRIYRIKNKDYIKIKQIGLEQQPIPFENNQGNVKKDAVINILKQYKSKFKIFDTIGLSNK